MASLCFYKPPQVSCMLATFCKGSSTLFPTEKTDLDTEQFRRLYKALVRPHLEYVNSVWMPRRKKNVTILDNVQRQATKLIPDLQDLTYTEILKKINLPSLVYRRLCIYKRWHEWNVQSCLNHSNIEAVQIKRQPGDRFSLKHKQKMYKMVSGTYDEQVMLDMYSYQGRRRTKIYQRAYIAIVKLSNVLTRPSWDSTIIKKG